MKYFDNIFNSDKNFSEIMSGSLWAILARIIGTLLGFAINIIVSRMYGASSVGNLAVVTSILSLLNIFTLLGTGTSMLRLIPEYINKYSFLSAFGLFKKARRLVVSCSLITGLILFLISDIIAEHVFHKPYLGFYLQLSSMFVVFRALTQLNTQALRGLKIIKWFAILQVIPQGTNLVILVLASIFLLDSHSIPIIAMLLGFFVAGIIGLLLVEYGFRGKIKENDSGVDCSYKNLLKISTPMLMTSSMSFIMGQTGVIILCILRPDSEVGLYAIAVKLSTLAVFMLQAINTMAGPKFSELYSQHKMSDLFIVARQSAKMMFFSTCPIIAVYLLFGESILGSVFGLEFKDAYTALVILALGQLINSLAGSSGMFLNMTGNQIALRNIMIIAAITNVILNVMLTFRLGLVGAAIANMASNILWNLLSVAYIWKKYGKTVSYLPFLTRERK